MQQNSIKDEMVHYPDMGIQTIAITSDIFDFLGYEGAARQKQQKFRELLDRAEIPHKQIAYDDPNADESVKKDGF